MQQIIAIVDSDIYPVLVRQFYSHAVFRPAFGEPSDPEQIKTGLAAAPRLLGVLDAFAAEGLQLAPDQFSLADVHLAPTIDAFAACPEGRLLLDAHDFLKRWFNRIAARDSFRETQVTLPWLQPPLQDGRLDATQTGVNKRRRPRWLMIRRHWFQPTGWRST